MSDEENPDAQDNAANMDGGQLLDHFRRAGIEAEDNQEETPEEETEIIQDEPDDAELDDAEDQAEDQAEEEETEETEEDEETEEEEESAEKTITQEQLNEVVKKRLSRLNKQHEAEKEELQQRLQALEAQQQQPQPLRISQLNSVEQVDQQLTQAQQAIQVVSKALTKEATDFDEDGNPVYDIGGNKFTREDLEHVQTGAFEVVSQAPRQRELIQQRANYDKALEDRFTFLVDKSDKEYPIAKQVMDSPIFQMINEQTPFAKEMAARYVLSERWLAAENQRQKAPPKKKPVKKKIGKAAADVGTAVTARTPKGKSVKARKKIISSGNLDSNQLKSFFKA